MKTDTESLARLVCEIHGVESLAEAREGVEVYTGQLTDDAHLWDEDAEQLTELGAELVLDAISAAYGHGYAATESGNILDEIAEQAAAIADAEQKIREQTIVRDDLIRSAMTRDIIRRADIAAAARVTQARLYQIRDRRR